MSEVRKQNMDKTKPKQSDNRPVKENIAVKPFNLNIIKNQNNLSITPNLDDPGNKKSCKECAAILSPDPRKKRRS